jgi:hypothetical protein
MLKLIAAVIGILVLVFVIRSFTAGDVSVPADPVTSSANLDLRVHAQAGVQVTIASLSNQMKQVMAAGNDPAQRRALDADLTALHAKVEESRSKLTTLGDSPAAVEQWLTHIGWPEFQRLEDEYRKAGGQ